MNAGMRTLDDDNYCEIMSSSKLVLVDNMAKWCGPCRLMEKIISKCEEKYGDDLVVAKFDVESGNSNVLIEFLKQDVSRLLIIPIGMNYCRTHPHFVYQRSCLENFPSSLYSKMAKP